MQLWLRLIAFGERHPLIFSGMAAIVLGCAAGVIMAADTRPLYGLGMGLLFGGLMFSVLAPWTILATRGERRNRGPGGIRRWAQERPVRWMVLVSVVGGSLVLVSQLLRGATVRSLAAMVVLLIVLSLLLAFAMRRR